MLAIEVVFQAENKTLENLLQCEDTKAICWCIAEIQT